MNEDLFRRLQEYHLISYHIKYCMMDDCIECKEINELLTLQRKAVVE